MDQRTAPEMSGQLDDVKWWETKKICDWTFKSAIPIASPLLEKLGPPIATVNLNYARGDDEKSVFVAYSNWFGTGRRAIDGIRDYSIDVLFKKVEQAFHDRVIAHSEIEWSEWLEVEIHGREEENEEGFLVGRHGRRESGSSLHVEFKLLKRATFPDGRDMVLDGTSLELFPKAKPFGKDIEREYNRHQYHQSSDSQYAYIPATPENLAAMKGIVRRINDLNDRLMGVLKQSAIKETIKLITGGKLALEDKR